MPTPLNIEITDNIALLTIDDGKLNVINPSLPGQLESELASLEERVQALVITGNARAFCSGYDLNIIKSNDADRRNQLVVDSWQMWLKLYNFKRPVVAAISGHALGMGAYLALAADYSIAATGDYQLGFTEVSLGVPMNSPPFWLPITQRLPANQHEQAILHAKRYSPEEALSGGLCHQTVPEKQLVNTSLAKAQQLSQLPQKAFVRTKQALRASCTEALQAGMDFWEKHGRPPAQ